MKTFSFVKYKYLEMLNFKKYKYIASCFKSKVITLYFVKNNKNSLTVHSSLDLKMFQCAAHKYDY